MLCGSFAERVRSGDISFLRDRPVAQLHEDQIPMAHLPRSGFLPPTCVAAPARRVLPSAGSPAELPVPGAARDKLFMRVIGSPDPYSAHIDGMGGATSSTSKCVILSKSSRPDHDVEYLYGRVDRQALRRLER